jgi:hypothetical protein
LTLSINYQLAANTGVNLRNVIHITVAAFQNGVRHRWQARLLSNLEMLLPAWEVVPTICHRVIVHQGSRMAIHSKVRKELV